MRADGVIALLVAGAITSACGVTDPTGAAPSVSVVATPAPATPTPGPAASTTVPGTAGQATTSPPTLDEPVRWTPVDTIDGAFVPGDTTALVAVNDAQWEAVWLGVGYPGERPAIDFGRDIVVVWSYGVSGSCDEDSLDDVVLDGSTIAPVFSSPYEPGTTCTADYNPRSRIVAIDRTSLPAVPFEIRFDGLPCAGCTVTVTDVSDTAPPVVPLSPGDLAQIVAAAVEFRTGGAAPDAAVAIEVVDTLAAAGGADPVAMRGGTPLDDATRTLLVDRLAPREVSFVPQSVVTEPRDGSTPFAVIAVAVPAVLEGRLTVESSVWCGPLCAESGAHELLIDDFRIWSVGGPVGPQTVA